jgi:hypothetical protein
LVKSISLLSWVAQSGKLNPDLHKPLEAIRILQEFSPSPQAARQRMEYYPKETKAWSVGMLRPCNSGQLLCPLSLLGPDNPFATGA